ncbi:MAG: NAD-dependent epimerase/dehydratase family protein, partial [Pseudomonadales bacterium]
MTFARKTILVTGATGFIGGRLVERLVLEEGANVRALVRNFSSASRIARFPVAMIRGDLTEADKVREAMQGCDVVFH